ncbi:hypothetical protein OR1_02988 [Geobacter sp. OR-1]|uniref:hypothetical protein n=1 Tax=Geobacter sp. OR-1 TaxID=1266765 RepID=UPI0005444D77|nr:hypothetical protein [Geobacter sp. OR-1]GAM10695.1 hypothetical protein OR1_02988 [Geobacter sp. OR-1]
MNPYKIIGTIFAMMALTLLNGCGGGGSSSGGVITPPTTTAITGVASKGMLKGGTVKVYTLPASRDINQKQLLTAAVVTSSIDGRYQINIGSHTGLVLLEASGSYTNEADGTRKTLDAPLRAALVIGSVGGTVNVAITPFTEVAVRLALTVNGTQGTILREEAVTAANALLTGLLPFDILSDLPVEPLNSELNGVSAPRQDYTLALAAVSKLATSSSLTGVIEDYRKQLFNTGRFSLAAVNAFKAALNDPATGFFASAFNNTGYQALTAGLEKFGYYTTTLKIYATGNFATTDIIKGIQLAITLPAGMSVKTGTDSLPLAGIITASGNAAIGSYFEPAGYNSSTNTLSFALISSTGFGSGEFATVMLQTSPTISPPVNTSFTASNVTVVTKGGESITDLTTVSFAIVN